MASIENAPNGKDNDTNNPHDESADITPSSSSPTAETPSASFEPTAATTAKRAMPAVDEKAAYRRPRNHPGNTTQQQPGAVSETPHFQDPSYSYAAAVQHSTAAPASNVDEKWKYRRHSNEKPGDVATLKPGATASSNTYAAEPGATATPTKTTIVAAANHADEKWKYRSHSNEASSSAESKPGATAAASTNYAAAEPGAAANRASASTTDEKWKYRRYSNDKSAPPNTAASQTASQQAGTTTNAASHDEKWKYRQNFPSLNQGQAGATGTAQGPITEAQRTRTTATRDSKPSYSGPPATRPGVVAARNYLMTEPSAPVTTQSKPAVDEKAAYRRSPVESTTTVKPTPADANGDELDKKSVFMFPPASKPGAVDSRKVATISPVRNRILGASEPESPATLSIVSPSRKSHASTTPLSAQWNNEKARHAAPPASKPGALPVLPTFDTSSVEAKQNMAMYQTSPRGRLDPIGRRPMEKNISFGSSFSSLNDNDSRVAIVDLVESDLLAKKQSMRGAGPRPTHPGVVSSKSITAENEKSNNPLQHDEKERLSKTEISGRFAVRGFDPAGEKQKEFPDSNPNIRNEISEKELAESKKFVEEIGGSNTRVMKIDSHDFTGTNSDFPISSQTLSSKSNPQFVESVTSPASMTVSPGASVSKPGMSSKDLAVATEIDEEAEISNLIRAENFEKETTKSVYQRPWFIALLALTISVALAGIITGVIVSTTGEDNTDYLRPGSLWDTPTASPTVPIPSTDEEDLRAWLLNVKNISSNVMDTSPVAFDMAVHWYANVDRSRDTSIPSSEYPWDFQRFLLAWFYYATSSNGTKPWVSCNPPDYAAGQSDTCSYFAFSAVSNDRTQVNYTVVPGQARWLSNSSFCDWPGITCGEDYPEFLPLYNPDSICNQTVYYMELYSFGLSGPLPAMLNQFPCLEALTLAYNSELTGTIPAAMFDFRLDSASYDNLLFLQIFNNSGLTGSIPDTMWYLPNLSGINLGDNGLGGSLPDLSVDGILPFLNALFLNGNNFTGSLPMFGAHQQYFYKLRLHQNEFNGTIPAEYGSLYFDELWLFENLLTGTVPPSVGSLEFMSSFRVQRNQLTGPFPDVNWPYATFLEISTNLLNGALPPGLAQSTMLEFLLVDENNFSGSIDPDFFTNLVELSDVRLRDNNFTGPIPPSLRNLAKLTALELNQNNFEGDVPFDICFLNLQLLQADCLGDPPQNPCFCCHSCCYHERGITSCQVTAF